MNTKYEDFTLNVAASDGPSEAEKVSDAEPTIQDSRTTVRQEAPIVRMPKVPEAAVAANDKDLAETAPKDAEARAPTEGKALCDRAKASLSGYETAYNKCEAELANLKAGDNHVAVYEALRDVVFFAIWAMDNPDEARDSFNEWEQFKPERKNTNPYTQPMNMIFAKAGVTLDSINVKRCEWAKIAEYVHPIAKRGGVNKGNFIRLVKSHGGIHGAYKWATKKGKKLSGRKSTGGKGMSSAEADKKFQTNFDKLKANQSGGSTERQLVAVILDITDSKTYPSLSRVKRTFEDLNETVYCLEIDETVLELMQEGGEADA